MVDDVVASCAGACRYESAKCLHGRPKVLRGKFYSSLFLHYHPADWSLSDEHVEQVIPPHYLDPIGDHPEIEALARSVPKIRVGAHDASARNINKGIINAHGVGFDSVTTTTLSSDGEDEPTLVS